MTQDKSIDSILAEVESRFGAGDDEGAVALLQGQLQDERCAVRLREWAVAERRLDVLSVVLDRLEQGHSPEAEISRAVRAQLWGNPAGALALLKPVLGTDPDIASAHHHAGRALHNLDRRTEALAAFRVAVQIEPHYAEAWYSLGHALRAVGRMEESIAAYRAVLQRAPSLRAALLNLAITLSTVDRADEALIPLDRLLTIDPHNVDALINKGLCLHVLGQAAAALKCYQLALQIDPDHAQAHYYVGCLLNEQMKVEEAREHLEASLRANPADPDVLTELAGLSELNNELDAAARYVEQGLEIAAGHPGLLLEAVRLDRRAGRGELAAQRLNAIDPKQLPSRSAQQYWHERALIEDRAGNAEIAIDAIGRANALAARSPRRQEIDPKGFPQRLDNIEAWLKLGAPGARAGNDDPTWSVSFRPAFLVGFPRSGTTLLDTMFDAHPDLASIDERPTIEHMADRLFDARGGYPSGMAELGKDDIAAAHACYQAAATHWLPELQGFNGVLLDKLPLRMLHVPLIRRVFPQAPILFAARHPCDVVLSNVMQLYRANEAFIHFDTIESAARIYDKVMRVWRASIGALSIHPHVIRYEDLVQSPQAVLTAACGYLGVDFDPGMLDTERRMQDRGRVRTNSYQQVAEPLYQRSVERWQRYRRWLEPVLPLLQPHITWLGYSDSAK